MRRSPVREVVVAGLGHTGGLVALGIVVLVVLLMLIPLSSVSVNADIGQRQEVVPLVDDLAEIGDLRLGSLTVDLRGLDLEPGATASMSLSPWGSGDALALTGPLLGGDR